MNEYLPILAIIVSIVGLLFQYFGMHLSLVQRVQSLETKTELFWKIVESRMPRLIADSPNPPVTRKNELLHKMEDHTLTVDEIKELICILHTDDMNDGDKVVARAMVTARLEMLLHDLTQQKGRKRWILGLM